MKSASLLTAMAELNVDVIGMDHGESALCLMDAYFFRRDNRDGRGKRIADRGAKK